MDVDPKLKDRPEPAKAVPVGKLAGPAVKSHPWEKMLGDKKPDAGVKYAKITSLDNDQALVESGRLGVLSVKTGASGTVRFDQFESRRSNLIGPE